MARPHRRAVVEAYLAEHRLELVLSEALNGVVNRRAPDLVLALGIVLRRHAQSAQSHTVVESMLNHAANEAEAANKALLYAQLVVTKVAQQLAPREVDQKPGVKELRSLEQQLSGLINDVLCDMPKDPIRTIGSGLLRVSSAQHSTAGQLVDAINEALVAEAHGLLRGLASRLGEGHLFSFLAPAVCRRSVTLGGLRGEGRANGCRVHFVASTCRGRLLAPVEQLRHPVAPPSAPLGAAGAAVSVEAQVDEPLTTLVAVVVDPVDGRVIDSSSFVLPPWAPGVSQAYQLSLGEAAGLSFVASFQ